jgi:primosomal protein N' (replication factor Y)
VYFYDVIIPRPVDTLFTYKYDKLLDCGIRVLVYIKGTLTPAVIYRLTEPPDYECKDIIKILDIEKPFFSKKYLNLIGNISNDYCCGLGEALEALFNKRILKSDFSKNIKNNTKIKRINNEVNQKMKYTDFQSHKELYNTIKEGHLVNLFENNNIEERIEYYYFIINQYMSEGKQIKIICSDEILCEYFVQRLLNKLSINVEPFFSKKRLSFRKKYINLYNRGELKILIGTRSILGIPGAKEGLIILENEEDEFYKQEESPYLQFRNVAVIYAKSLNVPLILGSSMPSVESLYKAKSGEYNHICCNSLKGNRSVIKIIDMKNSDAISKVLSTELYDVIYNNIKNKKKSVIIANKKGFSKHLVCSNCGAKLMCDRCYIQATYYKTKNYCKCNYCGTSVELKCKNCGEKNFFDLGFGLEHIEEILKKLFNEKILKIDKDDLMEEDKCLELYDRIDNGDFDILLGTFVILRRFKHLQINSGGILDIEELLSLPDFRIYEKTMRLLYKFVGYIDNFSEAGDFYIQSYDKNIILFKFLNEGKDSFYDYEISRRETFKYPPFVRLVRVVISSNKKEELSEKTQYIAEELKKMEAIEIIGPSVAPVFVLRSNFRYNFLIKSFDKEALKDCCKEIRRLFLKVKKGNMKCKIDIDPYVFI